MRIYIWVSGCTFKLSAYSSDRSLLLRKPVVSASHACCIRMFIMLPSLQFVFPALFGFLLLCAATETLPRAPDAAFEPPRFVEVPEVMIARQDGLDLPSALLPRMKYLANLPQERTSNSPSSAIAKRALFGIRQSCDPGFGLCNG